MRVIYLRVFITPGETLILSEAEVFGTVEYVGHGVIKGWAVDFTSPELSCEVVVIENGAEVSRLKADLHRCELLEKNIGAGRYGFVFKIPERFEDGAVHILHFRIAVNNEELTNSPVIYQHLPEADQTVFTTSSLLGNRVLVLAPHPDDETFGVGGSIALHRQFGDVVKVVFMTDGQAGVAGKVAEEAIAIRRSEATKALDVLGVDDFEFWNVPDRCLCDNQSIVFKLQELLKTYRPSLVYAPSPLEFHPDHKASSSHVWTALSTIRYQCSVAFYEVSRPFNPNCLVDISAVLEQKESAARAYGSQTSLYPYVESILGLNRFRALTVSSKCRYAEGLVLMPSQDLFNTSIDSFQRNQLLPFVSRDNQSLVSVIIRTKNRSATLYEALASVAGQTYGNLEVIVVNDGGDDVEDIIKEFATVLPIKHIRQAESSGRSAAGNIGFSNCSGKYICLLDDDDLWHANHVRKLADFLSTTGEDFAYSDCERLTYCFDSGDMVLSRKESPLFGLDYDRTRLYAGNFISVISAMFSRSLLEKSGGFDPGIHTFEDWDLWIRMSKFANFHRLPGITCTYRVFREHPIDAVAATLKVMGKYAGEWESDAYQKYAWHVVSVLRDENEKLRQRLDKTAQVEGDAQAAIVVSIEEHERLEAKTHQLAQELSDVKDELNRINQSGSLALGRSFGRFVPTRIKDFVMPVLRRLSSDN